MATESSFTILLNGESFTVKGDPRLLAVIESLKLRRGRVAVEINREVVPKSRWEGVTLRSGDQVEIVNFVGGG
jgi:thiamine biosynthesis protein ThiS